MPIRIVCIGKKHESWIQDGVQRYQKRLKRPFEVEWLLLPHSSREGLMARQEESERILSRVDDDDFLVLLDEKGEMLNSPELSQMLRRTLDASKRITLVIGGAYGVDATVHLRANIVWSLSPLVFPHQLVRLILLEQIYRSQEISLNNPYHHT